MTIFWYYLLNLPTKYPILCSHLVIQLGQKPSNHIYNQGVRVVEVGNTPDFHPSSPFFIPSRGNLPKKSINHLIYHNYDIIARHTLKIDLKRNLESICFCHPDLLQPSSLTDLFLILVFQYCKFIEEEVWTE